MSSLFREEELSPLQQPPDNEIRFATWKCRIFLCVCILATAFTLFVCFSCLCPVSEQTRHFIHRFFRNAFLLRSSSVNAFMGSFSPSASFTEGSFIYASSSLSTATMHERLQLPVHQTVVVAPQRRRHLDVRFDAQSGVRARLPRHLRRQTAHELLPVVDEERVLNRRGEQCGEGLTRGRDRICRCCI